MPRTEPAAQCIYCGTNRTPRTTEHVVPLSIGGRFEIPAASCKACQEKINREIENPLFGDQFAILRDRNGIRKKRKRKAKRPPRQSARNSMSVIAQYNCPPFERRIVVPTSAHPPVLWIERYSAPTFLKNTSDPNTIRPSQNLSTISNWILKRFAEATLPRDGLINVQFSSPTRTAGQFQRLLSKIACGMLFAAADNRTNLSEIRKFIEDGSSHQMAGNVFSCNIRDYAIGTHECRVFEIVENGQRWIYCAIRILPSIIDEVYFVRAPSYGSGELFEGSIDF
jgi:hypothetical protein